MNDRDLQIEAQSIAIDVHGGRPDKCQGWKAKMFNAAYAGAEQGLKRGYALAVAQKLDSSVSTAARKIAEEVLMARLPRVDAGKRTALRARIAKIRAGEGDGTPEVQAAALALAQSTTLGQTA